MTKNIYLILALIGAVVPYAFFVPFLMENGLNLSLLCQLLFANKISTFFALDFFISCIAFIVFMFYDSQKSHMKKEVWICLAGLFALGLSFSLPLFLFFRQSSKQNAGKKS